MRASPAAYVMSLAAVGLVAMLTSLTLPSLGLASAALLFLLPVLLASVRYGLGPGLFAAGAGALAYNFFLLPPRFTFEVHGFDNLVSVMVLFAVAVVTSRLATALQAREAEAKARASASDEQAALAALLGNGGGLDRALDWLAQLYGAARILPQGALPQPDAALSTLDLSAAAWAMHNGDITGHGSVVMPASEWSFVPLSPRRPDGSDLLAVARPADGTTRSSEAAAQLQALARLIGQARDRLALADERRARERLDDRDAMRRTLLASIAHDFRTPLTVIAGELAALDDPAAARARDQTRRLDRMMDDLLGAARIEGGAVVPRLEAVDLIDSLSSACDRLAPLLAKRTIERNLPADLPLVEADAVLLTHILVNLLDNAARHAASAIRIAAHVKAGKVALTIDDDGPGIAVGDRAAIFERFTRIEGNDRQGGSGLGLSIVKGFADAMQMTAAVDTAPDGGARFTLTLPAHKTVGA